MRWSDTEAPPRSLLFVPGDSLEKIRKSWKLGADGLIFDLEDAVPEHGKPLARENLQSTLNEAPQSEVSLFVRINSSSSPHWQRDIKAVLTRGLRGIVLPKCESPQEVLSVESALSEVEKAKGVPSGSVGLLLLIESARAVLEAASMARASRRVIGLIFGAEDFALDMGAPVSFDGRELLYARSHVAICARAYGCIAIDAVHSDFRDIEGLLRETKSCKQLGFSGKLAIHPMQIEPIHQAFAPTGQELDEARRILTIFDEAQAKGVDVVALNGKMIDNPIVERARRLVALAESRRH